MEEFKEKNKITINLENHIKALSVKIASVLDIELDKQISEMALIFAVNKDMDISLIEANPNGPKTIYDDNLYAIALIKYAIKLATVSKN